MGFSEVFQDNSELSEGFCEGITDVQIRRGISEQFQSEWIDESLRAFRGITEQFRGHHRLSDELHGV